MFHRVSSTLELVKCGPLRLFRSLRKGARWPITSGAYQVGDPTAPVAVCTLTSNDLIEVLSALPGVAIGGRLYTVNLGIEKIILNITANSHIRFLLLCGKESLVFHPGQALLALDRAGVTPEHRIVGAQGHLPVLSNIALDSITRFRRQIEIVDRIGETDVESLRAVVCELAARDPGPFVELTHKRKSGFSSQAVKDSAPSFVTIRPGGKRQPLAYDPKGFFVITLDGKSGEIVIRHYLPDNTPAHEMRGESAGAMLLGLLREGLVSQLSHAGYLGAELAKAETALRLGLAYEQDQSLRRGH